MLRKVLFCLLLVILLLSAIPIGPQPASAYDDISACLADGHGLMYCVWNVLSCRFLTDCEGDYPW